MNKNVKNKNIQISVKYTGIGTGALRNPCVKPKLSFHFLGTNIETEYLSYH